MATQTFVGDVVIQGSLAVSGGVSGAIPRSTITQDLSVQHPLPLTEFRIFDAFQTPLSTAGTDDLGLTAGAFGTGVPYVTSGDSKAASTTRRARCLFQLPISYVNGGAITIQFAAGMVTTVSDTTATIDVEAYLTGRSSLVSGSDLVTTAAQSINSLTFANYQFTVTPTSRIPGDTLDIRVTIAITDGATATAVIGAFANAEVLLTTKG